VNSRPALNAKQGWNGFSASCTFGVACNTNSILILLVFYYGLVNHALPCPLSPVPLLLTAQFQIRKCIIASVFLGFLNVKTVQIKEKRSNSKPHFSACLTAFCVNIGLCCVVNMGKMCVVERLLRENFAQLLGLRIGFCC
jgi:hypothetical protein